MPSFTKAISLVAALGATALATPLAPRAPGDVCILEGVRILDACNLLNNGLFGDNCPADITRARCRAQYEDCCDYQRNLDQNGVCTINGVAFPRPCAAYRDYLADPTTILLPDGTDLTTVPGELLDCCVANEARNEARPRMCIPDEEQEEESRPWYRCCKKKHGKKECQKKEDTSDCGKREERWCELCTYEDGERRCERTGNDDEGYDYCRIRNGRRECIRRGSPSIICTLLTGRCIENVE